MAPIEFTCPHCKAEIEAPGDVAGAEADCPGCNRRIVVPSPRAPAPPSWRNDPATPRQVGLIQEFGVESETGLTKGNASKLIDELIAAHSQRERDLDTLAPNFRFLPDSLSEQVASAVKRLGSDPLTTEALELIASEHLPVDLAPVLTAPMLPVDSLDLAEDYITEFVRYRYGGELAGEGVRSLALVSYRHGHLAQMAALYRMMQDKLRELNVDDDQVTKAKTKWYRDNSVTQNAFLHGRLKRFLPKFG